MYCNGGHVMEALLAWYRHHDNAQLAYANNLGWAQGPMEQPRTAQIEWLGLGVERSSCPGKLDRPTSTSFVRRALSRKAS